MLEDDAHGDMRWQVVVMSRERLDELIHQKRRHDETAGGRREGPARRRGRCFFQCSHLLEGNATTDQMNW